MNDDARRSWKLLDYTIFMRQHPLMLNENLFAIVNDEREREGDNPEKFHNQVENSFFMVCSPRLVISSAKACSPFSRIKRMQEIGRAHV